MSDQPLEYSKEEKAQGLDAAIRRALLAASPYVSPESLGADSLRLLHDVVDKAVEGRRWRWCLPGDRVLETDFFLGSGLRILPRCGAGYYEHLHEEGVYVYPGNRSFNRFSPRRNLSFRIVEEACKQHLPESED